MPQIQNTKDGKKYVVIPPGVTANVYQEGAFAVIKDGGRASVHDDAIVTAYMDSVIIARGESVVQLRHLARIVLSDGRTFVYGAPNEFLEITSPNPSSIGSQEPFRLTRALPVSPCPEPPRSLFCVKTMLRAD